MIQSLKLNSAAFNSVIMHKLIIYMLVQHDCSVKLHALLFSTVLDNKSPKGKKHYNVKALTLRHQTSEKKERFLPANAL